MAVPSYAVRAQRRAAANINNAGQSLILSRPATTTGGAEITWTLTGLPQPLAAQQVGELIVEGGLNAGSGLPHNFVFAGGVNVLENDKVAYNGFWYRIHAVTPTQIAGLQIMVQCATMREGKLQ